MQILSPTNLWQRTFAQLIFVFVFVIAVADNNLAQTNSKIANRQLQEWQTFAPSEFGFAVDLPREPDEIEMPFNTQAIEDLGAKFKVYQIDQPSARYIVVYSKAPTAMRQASNLNEYISDYFDAFEEALRRNDKLTVLSSKNSIVNNVIEREIILQAEAIVSKMKMYFVNGRYYGLQIATPDTQRMPAELAKIYKVESDKFFNSFQILDNRKQLVRLTKVKAK